MNKFKLFAFALTLTLGFVTQTYAQERGHSFSPAYSGYYYLRTVFTGDGLSLESNDPNSPYKNGASFMSPEKGVSGTMWQFVADPYNRGWYRLKSNFQGANKCLECNGVGSTVKGGASFMDNCQNVTGQLWRLELVAKNGDDHIYRLLSKLHGDKNSLEGNKPDSDYMGGSSFMDSKQNVSGQMWRLVPVK